MGYQVMPLGERSGDSKAKGSLPQVIISLLTGAEKVTRSQPSYLTQPFSSEKGTRGARAAKGPHLTQSQVTQTSLGAGPRATEGSSWGQLSLQIADLSSHCQGPVQSTG